MSPDEPRLARSQDVAARAGVSRATVSMILNGHGAAFSPETRTRVERAARELNYHPSIAAVSLVRGNSDIVVMLIPHVTMSEPLQEFVDPLGEDLHQLGLTLLLMMGSSSAEAIERALSGMRPRAVLAGSVLDHDQQDVLNRLGVTVLGGTRDDSSVAHDPVGRVQAQYLIARGHTRIAYAHLRDSRGDPFGTPRENGVRNACAAAGLEPPQVLHLDLTRESARGQLEGLQSLPAAIACYNDEVAIALMAGARDLGLRIPEDVALIGVDATRIGQLLSPRLTSVILDARLAARTAATMIADAIGVATPGWEPQMRMEILDGESA